MSLAVNKEKSIKAQIFSTEKIYPSSKSVEKLKEDLRIDTESLLFTSWNSS